MTIWIDKNGVIYRGGGIIIDGMRVFPVGEPDPELMRKAGYKEYVPPTPIPAPPKYSKRKIILALGEGWLEKKTELEAAGVYDLFANSTYLCVDDPTFQAVYEHLTEEEKRILNEECLYDE